MKPNVLSVHLFCYVAVCCLFAPLVAIAQPPQTAKHPVRDTYHGVQVTEDYRWLENWDDPKVKAWSNAQNKYARDYLDQLPNVPAIRKRLTELMSAQVTSYSDLHASNGHLFAIKRQPPKQQPFLVRMPSVELPDQAQTVVDPNVIDPDGTTSIDWYVPSPDGKRVAVSLSQGGTESGDVHLYDVESGKPIGEVIPRVNGGTAGGDVDWLPDGSGFFYTRYPRGNERAAEDMNFYQQLYFHKLGTPTEEDQYQLGKELPRIAEIKMELRHTTGWMIVTVQNGDGGEFAHFLRSPEGKWNQFSRFGDGTIQATFGSDRDILVLSRHNAPRGRILRLPIDQPDLQAAEVVVPEGEDTIVNDFWSKPTIVATPSKIYAVYQMGGPSEIRVFDLHGNPLPGPQHPPVADVGDVTPLDGDTILFAHQSFTHAPAQYRFSPETQSTDKTVLSSQSPVEFDDIKVVREFATSKDGTKVPVNIMMPKSAVMDGSNPCVVYGYGGYGVNLTPSFRARRRLLLDHGVIFVVANLRGGGEYGERWHRAGNLTNKQNVFDDFAAAVQHMVDQRYSHPSKLAIMGGSNGGLLMGATLTQHPEKMKAIVSYVGIYDMLRVELSPNGAFNIPEFGTVKNPDHFRALAAYSPYHNVEDGTAYPATLFLTGENDPRVDPMQSRKMTARLQAANTSDAPILLRTSASAGHGADTGLSELIEQETDVHAFLFHQLGINFSR